MSREARTDPELLERVDAVPAVPVALPAPVALTGVLVRDVAALTGLTAAEIGRAVGRSERSVRAWLAAGGHPESADLRLRQLRTIALRLVGGFGPVGVRRWLLAGDPPALELIARGDARAVLADTDRLLD